MTNPLSPNIASKLRETRRMLRRYVVLQCACAIFCWLLTIFWLGGLIDYLPVRAGSNETPRWVRVGMLAVMAVGVIWVLARMLLPRLLARLPDRSLALWIERQYPELNNELVTSVELCSATADVSNAQAYRKMLDRVHASADEHVRKVAPTELFNWQPLWGLGTATVLGLVLTGIALIGIPGWMHIWSDRLFSLSEKAWPRRAELRADAVELQVPPFTGQLLAERVVIPFVDNVARIPVGSAALLQISANTEATEVPEVCTMFYRSQSGSRGRANLRRIGSPRERWQAFTLDGPPLDGITESMSLDVVGLDARLRDLRLEVVEPTAISSMQIQSSYPKYLLADMRLRGERELVEYRSGLVIPEGTDVILRGAANSELLKVEYVVFSATAERDAGEGHMIRTATPHGRDFSIPLGSIVESQVVEIRLIDQYGLPAEQIPRYVIAMLEDTIPEIRSQLEGIGIAVTPQAVLPIRGSVSDDNTIAEVAAELTLDDNSRATVSLEIDDDGELQADVDLVKLLEAGQLAPAPGMALALVVSATDYYDLDAEPHVGRGQQQQLSVVTEDELLIILDRQELEQQQRLKLIVSELEQMRDLLQSVKSDLLTLASPTVDGRSTAEASGLVAMWQPDKAADAAQIQRRSAVRAQQCTLQGDKSQQELLSLAARVKNLKLQLINNRIDSYDRQDRLESRVYVPLQELLGGDYKQLQANLAELMAATVAQGGLRQADAAILSLDAVLLQLEAIRANMLDMASFNEIVDLVRGLLEDQDTLLEETQEEQRQRFLDLLNNK